MIHTAEISVQITGEEYGNLFHSRHEEGSKGKVINYSLAKYGIREVTGTIEPQSNGGKIFRCSAIINPARIANGGKHTRELFITNTCDCEQLIALCINFHNYMSNLMPVHNQLSDWLVRRIDYAIDIKTPYVEEYIKLLQGGSKPPWMDIPDTLHLQHKSPENRTHFKGSVRYSNKSATVNIYDKYLERKSMQERYGYIDTDEIADSKDILRIEVQCKYPRVYRLRKLENLSYNDFSSCCLVLYQDKKYILRCLSTIGGKADYLTYDTAKRKISQNTRRKKTQDRMFEVLVLVKKKRSIWKAQQYFSGSDNQYKSTIKRLYEDGINPVTLPNNSSIKTLPNLYPIVETELNRDYTFSR